MFFFNIRLHGMGHGAWEWREKDTLLAWRGMAFNGHHGRQRLRVIKWLAVLYCSLARRIEGSGRKVLLVLPQGLLLWSCMVEERVLASRVELKTH